MTDVQQRSVAGPVIGGLAIGAVSGFTWSAVCLFVVLVGAMTETMDTDEVPAFKYWFVYGGLALLAVPVVVGLLLVALRWRRPGFGLGIGFGLLAPICCWMMLGAVSWIPLG